MSHLRSPNKVSEFKIRRRKEKHSSTYSVKIYDVIDFPKKEPNSHLRESKEPLTAVIIGLEDDNASIKSCFFFLFFS